MPPTGDLNVTGDLTVTGAGARSTTVAGGAAPYDDRIFMLDSGVTAAMSGLTITGGKVPNAGGAIRSHGDLKLDRVAIKGNTVSDRSGGGIYSEGPLNITNSTVSGNSADTYGGGVTQFAATATITNSTISGNKADQFAGGVLAHSTTDHQELDDRLQQVQWDRWWHQIRARDRGPAEHDRCRQRHRQLRHQLRWVRRSDPLAGQQPQQ